MSKIIQSNLFSKLILKYRTILCLVFVFFMAATFSFFVTRNTENISALTTTGFSAGNIMSDAVMADYKSMSVDDIQRFLTAKNPCNNRDYNYYLELSKKPGYVWHWSDGNFVCLSEERFGDGETIGSGQTAAEVIYQAAQDYRINPRVLIVLLQKEQSLITDPIPNNSDYRKAAGFGCPDSGEGCSSQYYGFKNQVRRAANLFRTVLDGGWSNYPAYQTVYVQYNPNRNCGGSNVYIENRATSALYRYTPYQPNQAALGGGGDSCSAYGNRNFYSYYIEWFGNPHASIDGEVINIPEGEYTFTSDISNSRALGVASGDKNGTNIQIVEHNPNDRRQKWQIKKTSDGYYQFIHTATGKALDVSGGYASQGDNIQLWEPNDTCAQKWKIYSSGGNGELTFESACLSGMTMDVYGGSARIGDNINTWLTNNGVAQKWHLYIGKTIDNGVYYIPSAFNTQRGVDIHYNSEYDGANLNLWDMHDGAYQEWLLEYDTNSDAYKIINPATGKALDLHGGRAYQGANANLWSTNNTCAQKWKIIPRGNNYMILSSCSVGYALDVYGGENRNGANIQAWSVHDGLSERWTFKKVAQAISDGTYSLVSLASQSQAVDVFFAYTHNGANVASWSFHGGESERWTINYNAKTGDYTLTNPKSNKNLDVHNAAMYNGSNIQIYEKNGTCAQRWYAVAVNDDDDVYQFLSTCDSQKALDLSGGIARDGANIQLWEKNSTNAQRWSLVEQK